MAKKRRSWLRLSVFRLSMLVSLIFFVIFLLKEENGWDFGFFDLMELKALDVKFLNRGITPHSNKVAIAAIDEKSIQALGRWPWNRKHIAAMIDSLNLAGTRVIAFDIVFSDEDRSRFAYVANELAQGIEKIEQEECGEECQETRDVILDYIDDLKEKDDPDKVLAESIARADENDVGVILGFFIFTNPEEVKHLNPEILAHGIEAVELSKISMTSPLTPEDEHLYEQHYRTGLAIRAPLDIFADETDYFGHFSFLPDTDGSLRWADLIQEVKDDDPDHELLYPSLSLKASSVYLDQEIIINTYYKGVESISLGRGDGSVLIPCNHEGRLLVNYHGPEQTFTHYSVIDIIRAAYCSQVREEQPDAYTKMGCTKIIHIVNELKDKIILVGVTATAAYDLRVMPFQEDFPGVEIHANVIDNIINNNFLSRPDWAYYFELGVVLFFGLLFGLVLQRVAALWGALFIIALIGGYLVMDKYLFFSNGYLIQTVMPLTEAFMIFLSVYIYRYITEERERRRTRSAFQQYLNASVIDSVMNDFDKLKLGGERREISVLFSDIRSFTTLSETLTPDELGRLMNEYLNPMTKIVLKHDGVLDKYMGDAIMAFWGAPVNLPDSAHRACETALEMIDRLDKLRKFWQETYPDKPKMHSMRIGIGVNTGEMWVGNMGSDLRFDYSLLGDGVNLGSRVEGVNKEYGTCIIITEFTKERIGDTFLCRELDSIRVKGKLEPVRIYELVAKGKGKREQQELVAHFEKGLALYRQQKWDDAVASFKKVLEIVPDDFPATSFIERVEQYRQNPPPEQWDGVWVMTTK